VAQFASTLPPDAIIVLCLSGRGDKDMEVVVKALGL
jgi:tryptophan synthase beta subunit